MKIRRMLLSTENVTQPDFSLTDIDKYFIHATGMSKQMHAYNYGFKIYSLRSLI